MTELSIIESTRALIVEYVIEPTEPKRTDLRVRYEILRWQPHYKSKKYDAIRKEIMHTLGIKRPTSRLLTPAERSAKWSAQARKNVKELFAKNGYYIPTWASRIGGFITIHNRFHVNTDKTFPACPVCNGTLEDIRLEA
jgi:hypothetical protein